MVLLGIGFTNLVAFFFNFLQKFLHVRRIVDFKTFQRLQRIFQRIIFIFPFITDLFLIIFAVVKRHLIIKQRCLVQTAVRTVVCIYGNGFLALFARLRFN